MSALTAELLAEAPAGIRALPLDPRGFPIPWFVARQAGGVRDFRIMGRFQMALAVRDDLCWVCGRKNHPFKAFVIGPMCAINRTSGEPPSHLACARWSARACPFLTRPRMRRNEKNLPEGAVKADMHLDRNPGVTLVWTTRRYRPWRETPGDGLFYIGEPVRTEWFAEGRAATRAEVQASIDSGLPALTAMAGLEGDEALALLARMTTAALRHLPTEATRP